MEVLTTINKDAFDLINNCRIKVEPADSDSESEILEHKFEPIDIKEEIKEELIEEDGPEHFLNNEEDTTYSPASFTSNPGSPDSTWRVEIIEQPMKKVRFRYLSELQGTPHGPLLGEHSTRNNKSFPKVRLVGYEPSQNEVVKMRCWLVDKHNLEKGDERPHCHDLVVRKNIPKLDIVREPHEVVISRATNFTADFEGMVVLHSVVKNSENKYYHKLLQWKKRTDTPDVASLPTSSTKELDPMIKKQMKEIIKDINKNEVYLYFEAFVQYRNSVKVLCSTISHPIKNLKNPESGDLKIIKVINTFGKCEGNTEVGLFVEKVPPEIKIKFFYEDWEEFVKPEDVHRNVALTFRTPRFKKDITEDVKVRFCLYRESDGGESNLMEFTYLPSDTCNSKKRKIDSSQSRPSSVSSPRPSNYNEEIQEMEELFDEDIPIINPENIMSSESVMINTLLEGCESLTTSEKIRVENWSCNSLEFALGDNQIILLNDTIGQNLTSVLDSELMAVPNAMEGYSIIDPGQPRKVFESDGYMPDEEFEMQWPSTVPSIPVHEADAPGDDQTFLHDNPSEQSLPVLDRDLMAAVPNSMEGFSNIDPCQPRNVIRKDMRLQGFSIPNPFKPIYKSVGHVPVEKFEMSRGSTDSSIRVPKQGSSLSSADLDFMMNGEYVIKNILFTNIYKNHVNCLQKAVIYNKVGLLNNILRTVIKYELREKNKNFREIICKIKNYKQQTLIHTAVIYMRPKSPKIINDLINFGYDPMMKDGKGNTAYHLAAELKSSNALKALISSKKVGRINDLTSFTNFEGMNILHVAVRSQNYDNVELILSKNLVNIDSKTSASGDTALHIACTMQDMEIAKLLIDNGANMSEVNLSDYSPLQVCVTKNDHAMAAFLIAEGSNPNQECISLTVERNFELAENQLLYSTTDDKAEKDSDRISYNNNAFGLALDVMMFDILAGKDKTLKPIREINKTIKTKGVLWTKDQMLNLRRILGESDNWKLLLKKLDRDHLPDLTSFKKPENVLLNYIDTNKDEILGDCDDQTVKLAELFSSIGLHEAKQVLAAYEE